MTREEYSELFHKEQLNLVAFKQLFHCDQEVLRLVNAAIAAEREACAKACDEASLRFHALWEKFEYSEDQSMSIAASQCAAAIREMRRS